ncbi:M48 family metalloprotease [Aerosakkonema sp. BLCC-F183]|uniref:M48 family metalloprotease n=1 Tax=Aerosakkonema sp. BLCC-F183 TaxID=3342834 RepID=UPI0035B9E1EC
MVWKPTLYPLRISVGDVTYSMWFSGGRDDRDGPNPLGMLLTVILAPIAATVIQLGISRTREFSADAGAAKLTGNPRALARALQRLEAGARQMPIEGNPAFEPLLITGGETTIGQPLTACGVDRLLSKKNRSAILK